MFSMIQTHTLVMLFQNTYDFGGMKPYVYENSLYCDAADEDVHYSDCDGWDSSEEWSQTSL